MRVKEKKNIILVIVDALRADHVSYYGYKRNTTPNLDKIANQGIAYKKSFSQAPTTTSSIASIFTGLYPCQHKVFGYQEKISPKLPTIQKFLKEEGYETHAFVHNPHISPKAGYEDFDSFYQGKTDFFKKLGKFLQKNVWWGDARNLNKEFLKTLSKRNSSNPPFFSLLFYIDTHEPYSPPLKFYHQYTGNYLGKFLKIQYSRKEFAKIKYSVNEKKEIVNRYDAEISFWDEQFGKLFTNLRRKNFFEDTILIVTADHGEGFNKKTSGHGRLYESGIHVPLIIFSGDEFITKQLERKKESLVGLIDIFPTIVDLLNKNKVTKKYRLPGTSLLAKKKNKYIISEYIDGVAIREMKYKLIAHGEGYLSKITKTKRKKWELYDLESDPFEKKNLIDRKKDIKKRFNYILKKHLKGC